jgi:transposase-like protein
MSPTPATEAAGPGPIDRVPPTIWLQKVWTLCRCRHKVHFTRNVTAHAPEAYKKRLANDLQGIYNQPNAEAALVAYEALRVQYEKTCGKAM